jgi:hypothetical protein
MYGREPLAKVKSSWVGRQKEANITLRSIRQIHVEIISPGALPDRRSSE